MTATKVKNDVNADQAFEKSIETYRQNFGSYGEFTQDELEIMRQFFNLNGAAIELGGQADSIRSEVELIESQVADARRRYNGLISEGHTQRAMEAVEQIPNLRSRQDDLKKQLPSISLRLDELEKAVAEIDHSKYLEQAREAATAAEQSRCRAVSIFGRPGNVFKTIAEAKKSIG